MPLVTSEPASLPQWDPSNPSDVADPGAGKKTTGWQANEAPAYTTFNWWQQLTYFWTRYLQDVVNNVLNVEHYVTGASGGQHRDVNADSYAYRSARTIRRNLGNPAQGGWNYVLNTPTVVNGSTAGYIRPAVNSTNYDFVINLDRFIYGDGESPGSQYELDELELDYHRSSGSDTMDWTIGSWQLDNTGVTPSETTEASGSATGGTTTRGTYLATGLNIALSKNRTYYLRIRMRGQVVATDAAFFGAWVRLQRSFLE